MADKANGVVRDFCRVEISLNNIILPDDRLVSTPTTQDGLDKYAETDLRILGCDLIQTSGILLKLPQVAMATGQVLYQRFYYAKSFVKHNMEVLAMAAINVASKIEECPRRIRDVINVFHHIKQIRSGKLIMPLILDQQYINLKNQVIKAERRILKELGFSVHIQHPHKLIVLMLQQLEHERNEGIVRCAWNYMNDSFRSDVFVRFSHVTIACSCIYLASRQLQVPLPNNPPWYFVFGANEDDIREVAITILKLYARPKPNYVQLEKLVKDAKDAQQEHKLKSKAMKSSEFGTPNSSSRTASPKNVSPNPALANLKKPRQDSDDHSGHFNTAHTKRKYSPVRSHSDRSKSSSRSESHSPVRHKKRYSPTKYSSKVERERSPRLLPKQSKISKKKRNRSRSSTPEIPFSKKSHKKHIRDKASKESKDFKDRDYKDYKEYKELKLSPTLRSSNKHRNGQKSDGQYASAKHRR